MKNGNKSTRISLGEFDFLAQLERRARKSGESDLHPLVKGIGDDAAVIRQNDKTDLVITADLLVEGIDFRLDWTTPESLGHKALAVSLSDIAAMGAAPRFAMLSLGVPQPLWETGFVDAFYNGWFALAEHCGVTLIGGDVSRTPNELVVDSIVLGEVNAGRAVMRSGAQPGDLIYVTGSLGGAAGGLKLLELREAFTEVGSLTATLIDRQLRPQPRVAWGKFLGRERVATSMIDLSDGLSSDLAHLCEASGVGAVIDAESIPITNPDMDAQGALYLALNGGEDFELLFTIAPANEQRLPAQLDGISITKIGEISAAAGGMRIILNGEPRPLNPSGFEHFLGVPRLDLKFS